MAKAYPLIPRTNARLSPGDFWTIPLVDGSYACGRVLQIPKARFPGSNVQFLGALMDWHGTAPPSEALLKGVQPLRQGIMHIRSITRVGGCILGNRDLACEGIEPSVFINGAVVQRGYDYVRECRKSDVGSLPALSWWGWNFIWLVANLHFLGVDLSDDAEPRARDEIG